MHTNDKNIFQMKTVNKTLLHRAKCNICIIENGRIMSLVPKERKPTRPYKSGREIDIQTIRDMRYRATFHARKTHGISLSFKKRYIITRRDIAIFSNREVELSLGRRA